MRATRLWIVLLGLAVGQAAAAGKNIVLFVADDHGRDAGCYGNPVIQTPNLDRLAAEGLRFDYAFCTTASCSASRSVILTGLHNHANGQYGHEHHWHKFSSHRWVQSLPMLLSKAGYRTARAGKFHVAPEEAYPFDEVLKADGRNPVALADAARPFIAAASDKPFFLYICTLDPHRRGGPAHELPYMPDRFGNPAPGQSHAGVKEVIYDPQNVIVPPFLPDSPECRAELAQYYQSVSRVDQGIGRLVKHLKEARVYDDTLFIYISDNGIAMPGSKTTLYEPGMRLPCVIRLPGAPGRGSATDAIVSWVDITPTILDFAGLLDRNTSQVTGGLAMMPSDPHQPASRRIPYTFHGRSFLPLLEGRPWSGPDQVFASHTFHEITMYYPMRVLRDRRWKLIWNIAHPLEYPSASDLWASVTWQAALREGKTAMYGARTIEQFLHRPAFELYDLQHDPDEACNLADDPAHAQRLEAMKKDLRDFQQRTSDPWLLKWDYE